MLFTTPPPQPFINEPLAIIQPVYDEKPQPVLYTVKENDTLTSIAESHGETVQRLFDKNLNISSPDVIKVGQNLNIPSKDEKLEDRTPVFTQPTVQAPIAVRGGSLSNPYVFGWCVWLAYELRPDIHATGNAADWMRYVNSNVPKVGAIAVNTTAYGGYGHVGQVVDIGDGRILVHQMNWVGFGKESTDWVPLSYWQGYIL